MARSLAFFNPFRRSYIDDPYPALARLRAEDPVHFSRELDAWILTRHADCARVLRDNRAFASDAAAGSGGLSQHVAATRARSPLGHTPLLSSADPPVHTRLRAIVSRAFTPRVVEAQRPFIAETAGTLLDAVPRDEPFEFMSGLAEPLPVTVISHLLGLAPEERASVRQWATAVMRVAGGGELPPEGFAVAGDAMERLREFLAHYRERHAGPRYESSVFSVLLEAAEDHDQLAHDELIAFAVFLYTAGSGPTALMMANALLALSAHPEALAAVHDDPALLRGALQESLRWDSATQALPRFATEDVALGRRTVRRGDAVFVMVGAAQRDPEVFADPDRFDITRRIDGNDLLAFGIGPHFCLGQPLAYIEAEEVFTRLLERFPRLSLARGGFERGGTLLVRGPSRLVLAPA